MFTKQKNIMHNLNITYKHGFFLLWLFFAELFGYRSARFKSW